MNLQPKYLQYFAPPIELHELWRYQELNLNPRSANPAFYQIKLYPLYPKKDSNLYEISSVFFKNTLSTYSSTRIFNKAKVTWTLIITVMSSTLYQLSYSLICGWRICTSVFWSWVKNVTITLTRISWTKWDSNPW